MHTNAWHSSLLLSWTKKWFLMKKSAENRVRRMLENSYGLSFPWLQTCSLPPASDCHNHVTSTTSKEVSKPLVRPAQSVIFSMNSCRHSWIFLYSVGLCIYSIFLMNLSLTVPQFQQHQGKVNQTNKCVSAQWRKGKAPSFHVAVLKSWCLTMAISGSLPFLTSLQRPKFAS